MNEIKAEERNQSELDVSQEFYRDISASTSAMTMKRRRPFLLSHSMGDIAKIYDIRQSFMTTPSNVDVDGREMFSTQIKFGKLDISQKCSTQDDSHIVAPVFEQRNSQSLKQQQVSRFSVTAQRIKVRRVRLEPCRQFGFRSENVNNFQTKNNELVQEDTLLKKLIEDKSDIHTVQEIIQNEISQHKPKIIKTSQANSNDSQTNIKVEKNEMKKITNKSTQQINQRRNTQINCSVASQSTKNTLLSAMKKVKFTRTAMLFKKKPDENYQATKTDSNPKYDLAKEQLLKINQKEFYECFKNIEHIQMYKELYHQEDNIYVSLIQRALDGNKIPKAYPILKKQEVWLSQLDFRGGGTKNVDDIVQILKTPQCQKVSSIDLSLNNISYQLLQTTVDLIPKSLIHLQLSRCSIDILGITILVKSQMVNFNLKKLSLEGNKFGDIGCVKLMDSFSDSSKLISLNLSDNRLSYLCCESISNYLKRSLQIKELYLRFNNINQQGGACIFKVMQKQKTLKVLDISHNILGNQNRFYQLTQSHLLKVIDKRLFIEQSECLQQIIRFLSKPTEIVHLDISHNKFTVLEALEIQKAYNQNNTIYGFHFEGNVQSFSVDRHGYLQSIDQIQKTQSSLNLKARRYETLRFTDEQIITNNQNQIQEQEQIQFQQCHISRQIVGVNKIPQNNSLKSEQALDICWICEGYQELEILWMVGSSGQLSISPVFLHINIYGWEPMLMKELHKSFIRNIMVPPDTLVQYFFTNPILGIFTVARDQLAMDVSDDHQLSKPLPIVYNGEIIVDLPALKQINFIYSQREMKIVDDSQGYILKICSIPREVQEPFDFSAFLGNINRGWQLERSFFASYRIDSNTHLQQCFQTDFDSSKISKIVRDETESVRDILSEYYPFTFLAFKLFASFGSLNNMPSISLSVFYEFLANTRIMDGKLRNTDIDVMFVSSNGKDQNYPNIVDRAVVRYQLLELCVRIAMDKYYKTGIVQSAAQALVKLFEEDGIVEWLKEYDSGQEWRDYRYWNERTDTLINQSLPFLKCLFKYTAQLNPKNKYYNFVWVSSIDFKDLIVSLGVIGEHLSEREVYLAFLQSMMTQVDELYSNRHQQMSLHEFVEALARIAEKLSILLPLAVEKPEDVIRLTYHERILYDLPRKFKGFLMTIYFKISDQMKETLKSQADDDYYKIDSCMMSERDYRSFIQTQSKGPSRKTQEIIPKQSFSAFSGNESSNESFESSDSEKSLELPEKKSFIFDLIKDYSKKRDNRSKNKTQSKMLDQFTFSTFVKYIKQHKFS